MRKIVLISLLVLYIIFILFMVSPGGGHHGHDMMPTLIGHITDHPIEKSVVSESDNVVVQTAKSFNNTIAHLNETTLKNTLLFLRKKNPKHIYAGPSIMHDPH